VLTRVPGIASTTVFGAGQYALRYWVKPDQLAKLNITVGDVISAIQSQNTVNPTGQIGAEPAPKGQLFTYSVQAQGRLTTPEEFGQIVIRENPDGSLVRLKDVARVELGAQLYNVMARLNGKAAAIVAVYQLPGPTRSTRPRAWKRPWPIEAALSRRPRLHRGARYHPLRLGRRARDQPDALAGARPGRRRRLHLSPRLAGDPDSPAGRAGLAHRHLRLLSRLRLLGQHAVPLRPGPGDRPGGGRRHRRGRGGRAPYRRGNVAARRHAQAMSEVSGPVVAIALILAAVFVPTAFIPGITGRLYQQFALTIAISVMISAFNALTLSPALCALLLRPKKASTGVLGRFYGWFNRISAAPQTVMSAARGI
jgi:HAE1 family hydrophobic/amphiphilic exporter-1